MDLTTARYLARFDAGIDLHRTRAKRAKSDKSLTAGEQAREVAFHLGIVAAMTANRDAWLAAHDNEKSEIRIIF